VRDVGYKNCLLGSTYYHYTDRNVIMLLIEWQPHYWYQVLLRHCGYLVRV